MPQEVQESAHPVKKDSTDKIDSSYYSVWQTVDGIEFSSDDSVFLEDNPVILCENTAAIYRKILSAVILTVFIRYNHVHITRYIDAVNKLYQTKYTYQVTALYSLLRIQSTSA